MCLVVGVGRGNGSFDSFRPEFFFFPFSFLAEADCPESSNQIRQCQKSNADQVHSCHRVAVLLKTRASEPFSLVEQSKNLVGFVREAALNAGSRVDGSDDFGDECGENVDSRESNTNRS